MPNLTGGRFGCEMYAHKKMKTSKESSLEVLQEILPLLEAQTDYSNDALYQTLAGYVEQKGCKNGYVMWPEYRRRFGQMMIIKLRHQLFQREDLRVVLRTPAKKRHEIHDGGERQ